MVTTPTEITTSAADGTFSLFNLQPGVNLSTVTKSGYFTNTFVTPVTGTTAITNLGHPLSPIITDTNTLRFTLDWFPGPTNMSLGLDTPFTNFPFASQVNRLQQGSLTSVPFARMDVVHPELETMTVTNFAAGIYNLYVRDVGASGLLSNSTSLLNIFSAAGLLEQISLNTNTGSGDWWHVLQVNGSNNTYSVINTISNAQPTINSNAVYNKTFGGTFAGSGVGGPRIVNEPQDAFVLGGGSALLSIGVNGTTPFSFQWYRNSVLVSGATNSSLQLSNLSALNAGDYHVVVTNLLGTATSAVARVTSLSSTFPFVFVEPQNTIIDEGGSTELQVLAGGQRPLFYQWRHNGTNVPNAKSPLLTLTNIQPADAGRYDVIVANSFGTIFSRSADLLVSTPPGIADFVVTPGTNVAAGDAVNFGVGVDGKPPFNFTWMFNGQVLPSALSSNLTIAQAHFTNSGVYQVIVTNALGAATNPPVTLTVNSKPLIVVEPQNQFQTIGRGATLNVGAIGSQPISYQWRLGGTNLAGATSSNLVFTNIQANNVGFYTVVMSNQFGLTTSRVARVDVVLERAVLPWLQNFGGTGSDVGQSVGTDSAGNVYTVGKFSGTAQFGTNTLASAGVDDIFITKMDASGNLLWAKRFGGAGYDVANDVVVLPSGDVFITGGFQRIADFGGTSVTNTTVSSFSDLFVTRVDTNGNVVWVRAEGVQFFSDVGTSIAADGTNNALYVTGASTLDNFNGASIPNLGRVLLAKYDLAGGRIWARKAGAGNGGAQDRGLGVSIAPDQSVYQVGQFLSATHTNASTVLTNRSNPGFADGFVAKYDAAGALQWLRQIGSTGLDVAESVAATVNGDILVAGQLSGTNTIGTNVVVSSGGSLPDACIVNYDASGGVQWVRVFGGAGSDAAMDIAADPRGNIYITGFFQGTATFGSKSVESIAATKDVFVAGVRPDGTVEFVQQAGGDSIAGESGLGVAVDVNGGGVFTGQFQGTFVAGGDSQTSIGGDNVFVSRLVSPPPTMAATASTNGNVTFSWSSFRAGFVLESNGATLNSTNWSRINVDPGVVNGAFVFSTNTSTTNVLFLRLRQP